MSSTRSLLLFLMAVCIFSLAPIPGTQAGVGDPQVATNHTWYPGELACSTFERLQKTQAVMFEAATGRRPTTDEERVLASWLWRNTHYWHGEQGTEDLWGRGISNDSDSATREYWTGLFAHGFALCGTTHSQWTAEMQHLLGHNRARVAGVSGHNSFEVFLRGGAYRDGRWALLDHDISTVIFDPQGQRLLSINEIKEGKLALTKEQTTAPKQQGWPVCGLHPEDGNCYDTFQTAEYLAGYAGPPPMVHLRRGETLRRYLKPGLEDGKTYVFWGRNYQTDGIPGPERARTWVNQPEKLYGSTSGAGYRPGQARFANAVYTYRPNFANGDYREGVTSESDQQVTFEFNSPYIIAATPASSEAWGVYEPGCRNSLVIQSSKPIVVSVSIDRGQSWKQVVAQAADQTYTIDLTDFAKGHRQYWLRFESSAAELEGSDLKITTVCQANSSIIPRLTDNGSVVQFQSSGLALESAGPNIAQAAQHIVEGKFDSPRVTLQLAAPRKSTLAQVYAATHVASSNPPSSDFTYRIEYSVDSGKSWSDMVQDWRITRQGEQPADFWSQSFCWGSANLPETASGVQVRFRNDGGKRNLRAEVHLAYRLPREDATRVTFHWKDHSGLHTEDQTFAPGVPAGKPVWKLATGKGVETLWVEYAPEP